MARSFWTLILVNARTGAPTTLSCPTKAHAETRMETASRLEPLTYSHLLVIETRAGCAPIITQFENPKA